MTTATTEDVAAWAPPSRPIALLGPQHERQTLRNALQELGAGGPYVLVAAGWQEREAETGALEEHLGEPVSNLSLWPASERVFEADRDLRAKMFERFDRMRELSRIYRLRLAAELSALRTLLGDVDPAEPGDLVGPALEPAFEALERLDAHHVERITALTDATFEELCARPSVQEHRAYVAEEVGRAGTLLVAGGHVGILYNRMRLFGVPEFLPETTPVAGWSAGAMVLTDRILLFHDAPPQGAGDAEMYGPGFGLAPGVVCLPHASSRLALDDAARVSLLARRLGAHVRAVALDDGERVRANRESAGWIFDGATRLLGGDGRALAPAAGEAR